MFAWTSIEGSKKFTMLMSSWTKFPFFFLTNNEEQPLDIVFKEGQSATIECMFDVAVFNCYWMKDRCCYLKLKGGRYSLIGNLNNGNCTLQITDVQVSDEGHWQCESIVPLSDLTMKSTRAQITVQSKYQKEPPMNIVTDYNRTITRHPENWMAVQHENVILECQFNGPSPNCFWTKNDEMIMIDNKYQYIGKPNRGDCSINITRMELVDAGLWQCGYPRSNKMSTLKSTVANISIGVPPDDPVIVYNGVRMNDGDTLYVEHHNQHITIYCFSQNANPPAILQWTQNGQPIPHTIQTQIFTTRLYPVALWISRSVLKYHMPDSWNMGYLSCEAHHPLYSDYVKRVQVQLVVPDKHQRFLTTTPVQYPFKFGRRF